MSDFLWVIDMTKRKELDDVEELAEELNGRFISVHGEIRGLDEVIDEILSEKDAEKRRRFSVG